MNIDRRKKTFSDEFKYTLWEVTATDLVKSKINTGSPHELERLVRGLNNFGRNENGFTRRTNQFYKRSIPQDRTIYKTANRFSVDLNYLVDIKNNIFWDVIKATKCELSDLNYFDLKEEDEFPVRGNLDILAIYLAYTTYFKNMGMGDGDLLYGLCAKITFIRVMSVHPLSIIAEKLLEYLHPLFFQPKQGASHYFDLKDFKSSLSAYQKIITYL